MESIETSPRWANGAVLLARLIFAVMFLFSVAGKVLMFKMTEGSIAAAGFPLAGTLAVAAALFEAALVISLFTGLYFSEMALLGTVYVLFLAFAFHGPSHWTDPKGLEFGAFMSHFPFAAGMLFAAAHGPGPYLAMHRSFLTRPPALDRHSRSS